jgi:hypothetical protein
METIYIIKVRGMAEYKLIDEDHLFNMQNNPQVQLELELSSRKELNRSFEYEVVSFGPAAFMIERFKNYFVSQN